MSDVYYVGGPRDGQVVTPVQRTGQAPYAVGCVDEAKAYGCKTQHLYRNRNNDDGTRSLVWADIGGPWKEEEHPHRRPPVDPTRKVAMHAVRPLQHQDRDLREVRARSAEEEVMRKIVIRKAWMCSCGQSHAFRPGQWDVEVYENCVACGKRYSVFRERAVEAKRQ